MTNPSPTSDGEEQHIADFFFCLQDWMGMDGPHRQRLAMHGWYLPICFSLWQCLLKVTFVYTVF